MTHGDDNLLWETNPFSTRFVRPGAVDYLFPAGIDMDRLISELQRNRWCGQLVGPHGSGKSTLLHSICKELSRRERSVHSVTISSADRGADVRTLFADSRNGEQWVVDGFEQLTARQQRRLIRRADGQDCGLLVTVHEPGRLPTLFDTCPTLAQVERLTAQLSQGRSSSCSPEQIAQLYERFNPDIREMLFFLYDLTEAQRQSLG